MFDKVIPSRCRLGEAPVWLAEEKSLYWVDVSPPSKLYAWDSESGIVRKWLMPDVVASLAPRKRGGLVVVSRKSIGLFDIRSGDLETIASLESSLKRQRLNDCGCDRAGRLWTGSMIDNFDRDAVGSSEDYPQGSLFRVDPDHSVHKMTQIVGCPNTFVWSPDARYMYTADSATNEIYRYCYDMESGHLSSCVRLTTNPDHGVPDGSAMDKEGFFWNARWDASCILRLAPDGRVDQKVEIPAKQVTSCAFGGDELDDLYVTTARFGASAGDLNKFPLSGGVFVFKPAVSGMPVSRFGA